MLNNKKKIYVLLAPKFSDLAYEIFENLKNDFSELSVNGIVSGERKIYHQAKKKFDNIVYLEDIEKKIVKADYNLEKIEKFRKIFGDKVINNIIISDRHIGQGYVSGAIQFQSKLRELVQINNTLPVILAIELLDYFLKEFEKLKPDLVFIYALAGGPTLAMVEVAKYLNISTIRFHNTRKPDRFLLTTNIKEPLEPLLDKYNINRKNTENYKKAIQFLKKYRLTPSRPDYYSIETNRLIYFFTFKFFLKNILRLGYHMLFHEELLRKSYQEILFNLKIFLRYKFKKKMFDSYDLKKKFIYFPLHVDPEASTMVISSMYTNQLSIIESIAKSKPADCFLYIKENFTMLGKRPKFFYEQIKNMPNVKLIDPAEDNFALIKASHVIFTVTGTSGLEGIYLHKRVIFLNATSVFPLKKGYILCKNLAELPDILREIDNLKPCSDEELLNHIAFLYENSFDMNSELLWGSNINKMINQNHKTIKIITDKLKLYLK